MYKHNIFLTLTYADENLPPDGHLRPRDLQLFLKRLRKDAERSDSNIIRDRRSGVRYFACGEYGDESDRPHYHAILFNCTFKDAYRTAKDLYGSDTLTRLWGQGIANFGGATEAAANYIAQYSMKKQGAGDHDRDGVWRPAPFLRMSLRPAIGNEWLKKYKNDLAGGTLITKQGRQASIPRTYIEKLKETDKKLAAHIESTKHDYQTKVNKIDREQRLKDQEIIHKTIKELTDKRKNSRLDKRK